PPPSKKGEGAQAHNNAPSSLGRGAGGEALAPDALRYLLRFLDAYDFAPEATDDEVQTGAPKRLISAAVLGLIFEKINGYKDGSFYTPGFVTMYICRHTLRRAVVRHFAGAYPAAAAADIPDLKAWVAEQPRGQRPALAAHFNRLTVLDPAVGSGHFLVSALNELLAVKSELGLVLGDDGQRLPYRLKVAHDELLVEDEDTDQLVRYRVSAYDPTSGKRTVAAKATELQRTLFREKRALMEHALFGVDLNPNSVRICRLRLWIELLKHAYYRPDSEFQELETLPNLDLNIRAGNSLLSKYTLAEDLDYVFRHSRYSLATYRVTVSAYFAASGRDERQPLQELLTLIRADIHKLLRENDPLVRRVEETEALFAMAKRLNRDQFGNKFDSLDAQVFEPRRLELLLAKQRTELIQYEQAELFRDAFEWRYEFPEVLDDKGAFRGFDVVIGNPPYIRQEELTAFKDFFKTRFATFSGTADLYVYFIDLGMRLLADGGELSFIAPNKWLRAGYGQPLRRWLAAKQRLVEFVDFGDLPVFPEATTYPAILTMQRADPAPAFQAAALATLPAPDDFDAAVAAALVPTDATRLSEDGWNLGGAEQQDLVAKLRAAGTPLGEYVGGKIYYGIKTGFNPAFVIDETTRTRLITEDPGSADIIKPFLAGRDVKRYQQSTSTSYLIFTRRGIVLDKYPAVQKFLLAFRERLEPKPKKFEGEWKGRKPGTYKWYEIQDSIDYWREFEKPKIAFPDIAPILSFTLDTNNNYLANTTYFLPLDDLFLLGVLNSKPIDLVFRSLSATIRGGYLRFFKQYVEQLPIPRATPEQQAPIVALVEQILAAKATNPAADTTALEGEIDALVAALYGLTAEEAAQL
ncbi:MAG: Eco57I restriction-modification methylase domain-containing protein, partial [Hymenobacteraceae bacterium]|nr:Eco57I restriction-modification methylase domain-containing protein [Hymenobacteraceae bacterium]